MDLKFDIKMAKGLKLKSQKVLEPNSYLCITYRRKAGRAWGSPPPSSILNMVKVHNTTIILKIIILKLIDKHPKLMKSSKTLGFLKNYYKDINQICNENPNEFV